MGVDRLILMACVFAGGFLIGQINAPEPKVLPCMKKPVAWSAAKFVTYYKGAYK